MYPLAFGFGFRYVAVGTTMVSEVETPLPVFPMDVIYAGASARFLAKVQTDAEKSLGSYGPKEQEACMVVKLSNGGRLNRVFEQMGVSYGPRPLPGSEAFRPASRKKKADLSKKEGESHLS
jgi:hypothetical protein